jgi:lipoyl(octanoyl) transferase
LDYTKDPTCHIDFEAAWDCQKEIMNQHAERIDDGSYYSFLMTDGGCDTVMMLLHDPVYTLGTGSDEKFVLSLSEHVPSIRMDRGGEVTYHGPGQLTVYPIMDLRSYRQDIHWYMRALEEAIILALSRCGLSHTPERQDEVTGVWVNNHKVAAVGIKCRKWVTMHGLAVNVEEESLSIFGGIVPCGLEGRKVGCINQFIEEPITVNQFALMMKQGLEEVFQVELVEGDAI